jgi:hypothetical protein
MTLNTSSCAVALGWWHAARLRLRALLVLASPHRFELTLGLAGAVIALLLPFATEPPEVSWWWRLLIGFALGLGLTWALRSLRFLGSSFGIETIAVPIPFLGQSATLRLTPTQRANAWTLFVTLSTRIATQSLMVPGGFGAGRMDVAIKSLYDAFIVCRTELEKAGATPLLERKVSGGETFEGYVLEIMNRGLRPFLSRWHPLYERWVKDGGMPEESWPLMAECRQDHEATRRIVLGYMHGLARIAGIEDASSLLPQEPADAPTPELLPPEKIYPVAAALFPPLASDPETKGRALYIALAVKLPLLPARSEPAAVGAAVKQLGEFAAGLESGLPGLPRLPATGAAASPPADLRLIALLRTTLTPFLKTWSDLAATWTAAPAEAAAAEAPAETAAPDAPAEAAATEVPAEAAGPESPPSSTPGSDPVAACHAALVACIEESSSALDALGDQLRLL